MKTYQVKVTQVIDVTLDETKFTEAFMSEFRESFFPLFEISEHAEHLAQLFARGVGDFDSIRPFVEGYGPPEELGISCKEHAFETEVISTEVQA